MGAQMHQWGSRLITHMGKRWEIGLFHRLQCQTPLAGEINWVCSHTMFKSDKENIHFEAFA